MESKLQFDFATQQSILRKIAFIDAFQSRWQIEQLDEKLFLRQLKTEAMLESTGSSTRIEGSTLTNNEVESVLKNIKVSPPTDCATLDKPKSARHNQPQIDNLHAMLVTFNGGKNAAAILGFSDKMFLKLTAEIGNNVDAWACAKRFTSWLGLTPVTAQTGKTKRKKKNRAKTKAGQIFKEAAMAIKYK